MIISVVTVALNAEKTIAYSLDSVASQTHSEVEHLLIDGGSTDNTLAIAKQHGKHLSLLRSERDQGIYDAMNKGAKLAKGEVLGFLNADDFYVKKETLQEVATVFRDPTIDVCFGDLLYVRKKNSKTVIRLWRPGKYFPGRFALGWAPPHPTFFVRRLVFNAVGGFNLKYKLAADNDLMMRILECFGYKSHYLPKTIVKMRAGGVTNKNILNIIHGNKEILSALKSNGIKVNVWSYVKEKSLLKIKHYLAGLSKNQLFNM